MILFFYVGCKACMLLVYKAIIKKAMVKVVNISKQTTKHEPNLYFILPPVDSPLVKKKSVLVYAN